MDGPQPAQGSPKSILLATDLSSRCDRAFDRAMALAQQWRAKLVIVHVLEPLAGVERDPLVRSWRRPPDPVSVARRQLLADVGHMVADVQILIEEGDPAEVVTRVAEARKCDLIVTGTARDELFGRFLVGTTVDRLLRSSRLPLLVVRNRARHRYRHIAVATDFSNTSRHALETALRDFPGHALTLFHAYDCKTGGLVSDPQAYRRLCGEVAERECASFLESVGAAARRHVRAFVEFGAPSEVLRQGVRDMGIELVVLGTHSRGALLEAFVGSVAKTILAEVPCDVLLVRDRPASSELRVDDSVVRAGDSSAT